MKKSNLEKAIVMGVILSTGLYSNAFAEKIDEITSTQGIMISSGTTSHEGELNNLPIWNYGIVGAQASQSGSYDYTLTNTGKITISKNTESKINDLEDGKDYYYNDGISIKGGEKANFNFTIKSGGLEITKTKDYETNGSGSAGIGLNTGFQSSSNDRYVKADITLTKDAQSDGALNITEYEKGLSMGANTKLNITADSVTLAGDKDSKNKKESIGIEQNGKIEQASNYETESSLNIKATGGDINIVDYVNGISISGTGNSTSLSTDNGSINLTGANIKQDTGTITVKSQNAISIAITQNSKNNINLESANSINISDYITGINVYGEENTTGENKVYLESANSFNMTEVGTGILTEGVNSKVEIESNVKNIISASDKLQTEDSQNSPSGKAIMANYKSNVSLTARSNEIIGTIAAIDNKGASVSVNANNGTNNLRSQDSKTTAVRTQKGTTKIQGAQNIIGGGRGDDGYYYDGTAIEATVKVSSASNEVDKLADDDTTVKVDILASDYNKLHGIVKADGANTTINIGGSLNSGTLSGSKYNYIASQGIISNDSKSTVSAVYATDNATINMKAGNGSEQYNFITSKKAESSNDEKTVWAKDATINISGYQNHISAGGEYSTTNGKQSTTEFKENYSGTALEATSSNGTGKGIIKVEANGQNIIAGSVIASGANASIDITNTGNSATRADSFIGNNITSAKKDGESITAISATNQATVNIKADKAVNYIKAFSNNVDSNKSAKKVAISANDSTVNVSGLQNIIVAGDNREGMIVDAAEGSKTTVTIYSSLGSNLSGGLKAVGENNTIKIEGLSNAGNGTNQIISSAEVDTGVISAIYVKDKAQININDAKNNNFIATVSSDGQKSQKVVVVDNTTTTITGKNNTIAAGLTEKDSSFASTYKGTAIDVNNGTFTLTAKSSNKTEITSNSIQGKVNVTGSSTVNIDAKANSIISGSAEGSDIALNSESSKIDVITDTTNTIGGAVVASGSGSEINITGRDSGFVLSSGERIGDVFYGSNTIFSSAAVEDKVTAIMAKDQAIVRVQAGENNGTNTIQAIGKDGQQQQQVAISAGNATIGIGAGANNKVVAGGNSEGIALEAVKNDSGKSKIVLKAGDNNLINGAVKADGEKSNIYISASDGGGNIGNITYNSAGNTLSGSNQIISSAVIDIGKANEKIISAVSATGGAHVDLMAGTNERGNNQNYIVATDNPITKDGTQYEKRAVWSDNSTINLYGYSNYVIAGDKGEGVGLKASGDKSTIDASAKNENIITGAVLAESTSNIDIGYKKMNPDSSSGDFIEPEGELQKIKRTKLCLLM